MVACGPFEIKGTSMTNQNVSSQALPVLCLLNLTCKEKLSLSSPGNDGNRATCTGEHREQRFRRSSSWGSTRWNGLIDLVPGVPNCYGHDCSTQTQHKHNHTQPRQHENAAGAMHLPGGWRVFRGGEGDDSTVSECLGGQWCSVWLPVIGYAA